MKFLIIFFFIFSLSSCSSTKKVLICGDHKCINKDEADQYFKENLSLEIRIIDKENVKSFDLVKLNTEQSPTIIQKNVSKNKLKIFSKKELKQMKKKVEKKKKSSLKSAKKIIKNEKRVEKKFSQKVNTKEKDSSEINQYKKINKNNQIVKNDICEIVQKCDIDNISKYLIKIGKDKKFPKMNVVE
tara:strand:- start:95 stop:652 length:558 start_codon:yes stop_codon:yes gene_type:complete